jgi:hypothetical protein
LEKYEVHRFLESMKCKSHLTKSLSECASLSPLGVALDVEFMKLNAHREKILAIRRKYANLTMHEKGIAVGV